MPITKQTANSQATTIASGTAETTIVTADPNFPNALIGLIITTPNAAAATLTLRDSTAGNTRAIFDYPNAASAPSVPFIAMFDPPLSSTKNQAWTIQASAAAAAIHITALFDTVN